MGQYNNIYIYIYIYIHTHTSLQKYWNSESNSFLFAVDWKHLGLTSNDDYETRDQHFKFYFQVFSSGSDKQLRGQHLLFEPTHCSGYQKYLNMTDQCVLLPWCVILHQTINITECLRSVSDFACEESLIVRCVTNMKTREKQGMVKMENQSEPLHKHRPKPVQPLGMSWGRKKPLVY